MISFSRSALTLSERRRDRTYERQSLRMTEPRHLLQCVDEVSPDPAAIDEHRASGGRQAIEAAAPFARRLRACHPHSHSRRPTCDSRKLSDLLRICNPSPRMAAHSEAKTSAAR